MRFTPPRSVMALSALALIGAGCVSLVPDAGPAPRVFALSPSPKADAAAAVLPAPVIVEVARPDAPAAFATDRIVIIEESGEVASAADAKWSAPPAAMVGDVLFAHLEAAAVTPTRPTDGVRADLILRTDIAAFHAAPGQGRDHAVTLTIRARLVGAASRDLIAAQRFDVTVDASGGSLTAMVGAFDDALAAVAGDMAAWVDTAAAMPDDKSNAV